MADIDGQDLTADDVDTTPDNDESDAGDDTGASDYTPPSRDEWERVQAALAKANAEAKKHRLRARDLEKGKPEDQNDDSEAKAREAAEARYKPIVVKAAARAALMEAGVGSDRVGKLMRLIDMSDVDVDEDGEVLGLGGQIETIKTDYPELFEEKRKARAPRVNGADRPGAPVPKSSADRIAQMLQG